MVSKAADQALHAASQALHAGRIVFSHLPFAGTFYRAHGKR